jgi:hypothetical protein
MCETKYRDSEGAESVHCYLQDNQQWFELEYGTAEPFTTAFIPDYSMQYVQSRLRVTCFRLSSRISMSLVQHLAYRIGGLFAWANKRCHRD